MSSQQDKNDKKNDRVVIKKYANRRLYNTKTSAYIVLSDVIDLINEGAEFVIEDAKTGEDITRSILNQIIFEQETQPNTFLFPLEFQKQLIRLYNDTYGQMVPDFLTQSIKFFTAERGEWQKNLTSMMAQNTESIMRQSEALARQNMEMFRKSWDVFGVMQDADKKSAKKKPEDRRQKPTAEVEEEDRSDSARSNELRELQKQIDDLQSRLKSLK